MRCGCWVWVLGESTICEAYPASVHVFRHCPMRKFPAETLETVKTGVVGI